MRFKLANGVSLSLALTLLAGCGGGGATSPNTPNPYGNQVAHWNNVALEATRLDHTAPTDSSRTTFKEQAGPVRTARALAIAHIAMYDAVQSIARKYKTYTTIGDQTTTANKDVAAAQAAHDTLVALYPAQTAYFNGELNNDLRAVQDSTEKTEGIRIGKLAAQLILNDRQADGSANSEVGYTPSGAYLRWASDPINPGQKALGPRWGQVKPFVILSGSQFRCPTPPGSGSAAYKAACQELVDYGGDGITTPTKRTKEQTEVGDYWGYDGANKIGVPPRLYNQIARTIMEARNYKIEDYSRMLAAVNVAMADAGIACWESKYYYDYARPVTAIRANTGADLGVANFSPLGAPASNKIANNFTPNFPAYPSGHAAFGSAMFDTLGYVLGSKNVPFTFVSEELNGVTTDNTGKVRPFRPRSFRNFDEAEEENGQSRIYLGIHWSYDKTAGIDQGRQVAKYVMDHAFQPR